MLAIERTLEELRTFRAPDQKALSVYLLTDPSRPGGGKPVTQLRDTLRELARRLPPGTDPEHTFQQDAAAIEQYLAGLEPPPRSVAIFSHSPSDFFRALPLPTRFTPRAEAGETFHLRPLLTALDEYEHTIVVLLDKERARFFHTFLDQIEEIETFTDEVPGKHAQGGYSQPAFQRHHELHVLWHARRAADTLTRLADRERLDRIFIGGPPEALAELRRLLPKRLRQRIAGQLAIPLFAAPADVLAAVQEAERTIEREAEEELLAELDERRGAGLAAFGPGDVAQAVNEQRAYLLAFSTGLALEGAHCERCGLLAAAPAPATCPACNAPLHPVPDLVDRLAERVLELGGRIEELRGPAADRLARRGGIAALLRYAVRTPAPAGA